MGKEFDPTVAAIRSYTPEVSKEYHCDVPPEHAEIFIQLCKLQPGLVVDAGCGTGDITKYLTDQGLEVEGFDASPSQIAVAVSRYRDLKDKFFQDKIENFSKRYPPHSVQGIWFGYSLIHMSQEAIVAAIKESSKSLVPGGVMYLAFQESRTDEPGVLENRHPQEREKTHITTVSENFLHPVFEELEMIQLQFVTREPFEGERDIPKGFRTYVLMSDPEILLSE